MNGATVLVEYGIKVTNIGELAGFVKGIVDNVPKGFEFYSTMNKSWFATKDALETNVLSNEMILPGESKEVVLILAKDMTENTTGTFVNSVNISEYYNEADREDKLNQNNMNEATLIISISTGTVIIYLGLIISSIAIIAVGVYLIKKKVLIM